MVHSIDICSYSHGFLHLKSLILFLWWSFYGKEGVIGSDHLCLCQSIALSHHLARSGRHQWPVMSVHFGLIRSRICRHQQFAILWRKWKDGTQRRAIGGTMAKEILRNFWVYSAKMFFLKFRILSMINDFRVTCDHFCLARLEPHTSTRVVQVESATWQVKRPQSQL